MNPGSPQVLSGIPAAVTSSLLHALNAGAARAPSLKTSSLRQSGNTECLNRLYRIQGDIGPIQ